MLCVLEAIHNTLAVQDLEFAAQRLHLRGLHPLTRIARKRNPTSPRWGEVTRGAAVRSTGSEFAVTGLLLRCRRAMQSQPGTAPTSPRRGEVGMRSMPGEGASSVDGEMP